MSDYFDSTTNRVSTGSIARSSHVNSLRDETGVAFDKLPSPDAIKQGTITYGVDTGTADTYEITMPFPTTSYIEGMEVVFSPGNDNTGASTINIDGLGAIAIRRPDNTELQSGDITAGNTVSLRYNGSNFRYTGGAPISSFIETTANAAIAVSAAADAAADAAATAADRVQTGLDAAATAADRVQTGLDRTATETASLHFPNITGDVTATQGDINQLAGFELGDAAEYTVTASSTDTTVNRLTKTGDFGLGALSTPVILSNLDSGSIPAGIYRVDNTTTGTKPSGFSSGGLLVITINANAQTHLLQSNISSEMWYRGRDLGVNGTWERIFNTVTTNTTWQIGSGETYTTINAALAAASKLYPIYANTGVRLTLNLKAGFIMAEQVICDGIDLGWITITGTDTTTTIARSSLTVAQVGNRFTKYPAFAARNGGILPYLSQNFSMDTSGVSTDKVGIFLTDGGKLHSSSITISSCGSGNIYVLNGSTLTSDVLSSLSSGSYGLFISNASTVSVDTLSVTNGDSGVTVEAGSVLAAENNINAQLTTVSGIRVAEGGKITSGGNVNGQVGGSPASGDIDISSGGMLICSSHTGDVNITPGTFTADGFINT